MATEPIVQRNDEPARLDCILLPAISIFTIFLILIPTEFCARQLFRETRTNSFDCLVLRDFKNGIHGIPNSHCLEKVYEGGLIEYKFNSCGHRTGMECGPKPRDTFRIVLLGTSVAEGLRTPFEQTFAALLPKELAQKTGRKVEVYNEGIMYGTPALYDLRFMYVLAAQPDLILWTITKWDIEHVSLVEGDEEFTNHADLKEPARQSVAGGLMASDWFARMTNFGKGLLRVPLPRVWEVVNDEVDRKSRTIFMLKHVLYESQSEYLRHYIMQGEAAAFLRTKPSAKWQSEMRKFDDYFRDIEARAKAAGIPLIATAIPERAEAAMISRGEWPAGYNPYEFGEQVRKVIESHGAIYIDVLHGFRHIPNPEQYWLPVDKHPNAGGHAILSDLLAEGLTSSAAPELNRNAALQTSAGGGQ